MIIGIDAGGTKTLAILFDKGQKIDECTEGMGNILVDYDAALSNIKSAVSKLIVNNNISVSDIQYISIGAAGSSSQSERIKQDLEADLMVPIYLETDLYMSHIASFQNGDGILLIAGTGSSVLAKEDGGVKQVGGWGPILGDQGSAYWIGKQMVLDYIDHIEGGLTKPGFDQVAEKLDEILPDRASILNLFYKKDKSKVAKLALVLGGLESNKYKKSICEMVARDLADLVIKAHPDKGQVRLALEGSVIRKNQEINEIFMGHLKDYYGNKLNLVETVNGAYAGPYLGGK